MFETLPRCSDPMDNYPDYGSQRNLSELRTVDSVFPAFTSPPSESPAGSVITYDPESPVVRKHDEDIDVPLGAVEETAHSTAMHDQSVRRPIVVTCGDNSPHGITGLLNSLLEQSTSSNDT